MYLYLFPVLLLLSLFLTVSCADIEDVQSYPSYDYIVVGLGAAGSIIASRLVEADYTVLGIEIGRRTHRSLNGTDYVAASYYIDENGNVDYGTPFTRFDVPLYLQSIYVPPTPYPSFNLYNNGKKIDSWAARILGGSGAHNGMIFSRFTKANFDGWGVQGWSYNDVLPFYKKIENVTGTQSATVNPTYHGFDGRIKISDVPTNQYFSAVTPFVQACVNSGLPRNLDFNGPTREGCGTQVFNIRKGIRDSSAQAYLSFAARRGNLRLALQSTVNKILFDREPGCNPRAKGVEYIQNGVTKRVYADKEVIITAGALNTPRILQRSGVGPTALLQSLNIDIVLANNNVGKNLRNNQYAGTLWSYPSAVIPNAFSISAIATEYAMNQTGVFSFPAVFGFAYGCSKKGPCPDPDYVLGTAGGLPYIGGNVTGQTLASYCETSAPISSGVLSIKSKDPFEDIFINFPTFGNEADLNATIAGLQKLRQIRQTYPANITFPQEIIPGPSVQTYQDYKNYVLNNGQLVGHWIGSTKMGNDGDSTRVVDPKLRVVGIDNLRIGDTSPLIRMNSHSHASALMIGERCAQFILADA